jgi:hypothetical protein
MRELRQKNRQEISIDCGVSILRNLKGAERSAQEGIARCLAEDSLLPVGGNYQSESIDMNGQHAGIWSIPALDLGHDLRSALRFL